jgi:hypothetical protein
MRSESMSRLSSVASRAARRRARRSRVAAASPRRSRCSCGARGVERWALPLQAAPSVSAAGSRRRVSMAIALGGGRHGERGEGAGGADAAGEMRSPRARVGAPAAASSASPRPPAAASASASSHEDWIAMVMPSATSGWASPAAFPTAKVPRGRAYACRAGSGRPRATRLRVCAPASVSRTPRQCRIACATTASPAVAWPGRIARSVSRRMQQEKLTRSESLSHQSAVAAGKSTSGISPRAGARRRNAP